MAKKPSKALEAKRSRALHVLRELKVAYPDAACSLRFSTPLELLVATILSAQCTDARVNLVTPGLFKKYRTPAAYAATPQGVLEKEIQSTGFFRSKAKAIRSMAGDIVEKFGGKVPQTMDALTALAGVGRKTANVVLGNAFNINVGVTVDTHVTRLSNRLRLTNHETDAVKIEQDLMPLVPQDDWALWSHLLIHHGRAICIARKPACRRCVLLDVCPSGPKFIRAGAAAEN